MYTYQNNTRYDLDKKNVAIEYVERVIKIFIFKWTVEIKDISSPQIILLDSVALGYFK